mgnify:CR=1 FL=1
MWNVCKYITQNSGTEVDPLGGHCCNKKSYGDYCHKHKRNYLFDQTNMIIPENFTHQSKDYLVKDLKSYYSRNIDTKKGNYKKQYYFEKVSEHINAPRFYSMDNIVLLQYHIRRYIKNIYKRCNNAEDFYTFDTLNTVPLKYFLHYKDTKGLYWGFDIRSLNKLMQLNTNNPYTTESIPDIIITKVNKRMTELKLTKEYEDITDTIIQDRKTLIKRKIVDLFSDIERNGYSCEINWFTTLTIRRLKELYRQLEDLWNYRLKYNEETKKRLIPPHGRLFTTPISTVAEYNKIEDLQELIIHDILKFMNIQNESDKKLGYMYFLLCLSYVDSSCFICHQGWISAINA